MLQTQVNYWTLVEGKRHNLETENQGRENLRLGWDTLTETRRHNVQGENLGWANYGETVRHNLVTESQTDFANRESKRTHKANEMLSSESNRIGWENAAINQIQAGAAATNAAANSLNASVNQANYNWNVSHYPDQVLWKNRELSVAERNAASNESQASTAKDRNLTEIGKGILQVLPFIL